MPTLTVLIPDADVIIDDFISEIKQRYSNSLFWEFPENNTHPTKLRAIACLAAKNIRNGQSVCIVTYSFSLLNEINSLITLAFPSQRLEFLQEKEMLMQKYGYSENELILSENAKAFHLKEVDSKLVYEQIEVRWCGIYDTELGICVTNSNQRSDDIHYSVIDSAIEFSDE